MPVEPFQHFEIGRTGLTTTRLGLGGASIGGLFRPVADADAIALVDHAWAIGVRSFDVAPLYGYGNAERRMGVALAARPREDYVLSTKVGRLVRPRAAIPADADIDRQSDGTRDDAYYTDVGDRGVVFDYSGDGVRRSLEESLARMGLSRIDIAYIHDPDDHWDDALRGAYPALERLRAEGTIRAIGAGMNQAEMLTRFVTETDIDVVMLAGRYTLLDQAALPDLLPRCTERGVAVMVVGVMNSGVLADPGASGHFDYRPASEPVLDRVQRIAAVCERHAVLLRTAAIQFPLAHPSVAGLIAGVRTSAHLDDYPAAMRRSIPSAMWDELRAEGLIPAEAPVPPMSRVIDAHQHVLDPDRAPYPWMTAEVDVLRRPFPIDELVPQLDAAGVDGTVAVQARTELDETRDLLALAAAAPTVKGVVGWADLTDRALGDVLAAVRAGPGGDRLVGIRHPAHDEPDPEWLLRPDVRRGIAIAGRSGLAIDLLVRPREMPAAIELVRGEPATRFVVDHLGKPPIAAGTLEPWATLLADIAGLPNTWCKLSGLVTEAAWDTWTVDDLRPSVAWALDAFGPGRLLFGSDWPVCLLAGSYQAVIGAARELTARLSADERAAIFGGAAEDVYRLGS